MSVVGRREGEEEGEGEGESVQVNTIESKQTQ